MQSFNELVKQRVRRIRCDPWNKYAHVEIDLYESGHHGPWVTLHDVYDPERDGPFEKKYLVMQIIPDADAVGWEPWEPPEDYKRIYPELEI